MHTKSFSNVWRLLHDGLLFFSKGWKKRLTARHGKGAIRHQADAVRHARVAGGARVLIPSDYI